MEESIATALANHSDEHVRSLVRKQTSPAKSAARLQLGIDLQGRGVCRQRALVIATPKSHFSLFHFGGGFRIVRVATGRCLDR